MNSASNRGTTKYIFVTGGVVSSLGKGIASATLGCLLECHGLRVANLKFDPYLNVDPGTMSPYQHGEVFVTDDGAETDLDLGHYERFTRAPLSGLNNVTAGRVYQTIIEKERRGEYLGKTVQVVPHVTDEIRRRIYMLASSAGARGNEPYDVVITEIGGTVGDIEALAFLEAIRQVPFDVGKENVLYVHLTLVPFIRAAGEIKTKPTQHSVKEMREIGIQPDVLLCRTEKAFDEESARKIALFCNVASEAVFQVTDIDEIYKMPLAYHGQGLDRLLLARLGLVDRVNADGNATPAENSAATAPAQSLGQWRELARAADAIAADPEAVVNIGFVGKYVNLQDAYKSVSEALRHAGFANGVKVVVHRIEAEEVEEAESLAGDLRRMDGILIPGGFGQRGIEGKIASCALARAEGIPYFGICLGMQVAVIEFARHACSLASAHSTEMDAETEAPIIDLMAAQKSVTALGGTMRLGAYDCRIESGTLAQAAYGSSRASERHRHRYEVNNRYLPALREAGLVVSGVNDATGLVEMIELPRDSHPWFLGCQFHPEFKSQPLSPHPLFREFIRAAKERRVGAQAIA